MYMYMYMYMYMCLLQSVSTPVCVCYIYKKGKDLHNVLTSLMHYVNIDLYWSHPSVHIKTCITL